MPNSEHPVEPARTDNARAGARPVLGRTIHDSVPAWPTDIAGQATRPNVLVILLDDVGFAQLGCYGSDLETPALDQLASEGLRYSNFHVTPMCSPTRASLLTGRNCHSVGFGHIVERAAGFPGYNARLPDNAATIAEILRGNSYSTWAIGKWHLTPSYETGPGGPFDRWPLGRGFERFYGFLGASTDQYEPELQRDNSPTSRPDRPTYHLTEDLADEAITRIRELDAISPDKPFFLYWAPGACHTPHQVPSEWSDRYRGRFDDGWDESRLAALSRQKDLGLFPQDTKLAPSNPGVLDWATLPEDQKRVYARMMEVYAGFLSHTDAQIGRILGFLKELGKLDNTLVMVLSDNGASAEGGPEGSLDEGLYLNDLQQSAQDAIAWQDEIGGPRFYNHYPWGWAQSGSTPFRWYKTFTHAGGIRAPLIMRFPAEVPACGEIRDQFHHVVDLAPTILEVARVAWPETVKGVSQMPAHGTSMAYTWSDAQAPTRRRSQYFEVWGNRGVWADGWMAVSRLQPDPPGGWPPAAVTDDLDTVGWELYDHRNDPSERRDLAAAEPVKLRQLVETWWASAGQYQVLPVDTRSRSKRWNKQPSPPGSASDRWVFTGRCGPFERGVSPTIMGRSFQAVAEIDCADRVEGVVFALGGRHGGYSWSIHSGELVFTVNLMALQQFETRGPVELTPGTHHLALKADMKSDLSADIVMELDGAVVSSGSIPRMLKVPPIGSGRVTIGFDPAPTVSDRYRAPSELTATLKTLTITSGDALDWESLGNAEARAQ